MQGMQSKQFKQSKIIVLLGPTASGKTAWAEQLAKRFNGEIISADSRQVYRGMDIGTAKDKSVPQHLIDIIDPDETMSVAEYKVMAIRTIRDIAERGKIPFFVGGTAQYIYAVVDNWIIPAAPPNANIRKDLEARSREDLEAMLREKDPNALSFVDVKNKRRLVRALEVVLKTGELFSKQRQKGPSLFDALLLGIEIERTELNHRIDARVS